MAIKHKTGKNTHHKPATAVKKTASELSKERLQREKSAKRSGHAIRSNKAKKAARSISKQERKLRAEKGWKSRRKFYGPKGTTVRKSHSVKKVKKA